MPLRAAERTARAVCAAASLWLAGARAHAQDGEQEEAEDELVAEPEQPLWGVQGEAALVSNSIWRGAALWTPALQPGVIASADARIEDVHGFDLTTGVWLATPLHLAANHGNRQATWVVPSLGATYWLSDSFYSELAYGVYLQPGAQRVDYQHDLAAVFGYTRELQNAWSLTLSAECDADPVRRKGAYLHGDLGLDYEGESWSATFTLEVGASRYAGSDAVDWGLQAAMVRAALQRALAAGLYAKLEGVLAFSEQTAIWQEGRSHAALSLALGWDYERPF